MTVQTEPSTTTVAGARPQRPDVYTRLGLGSLRGRFLYIAGGCLGFLLALALVAGLKVEHATSDALSRSQQHRGIRLSLELLADHVWQANNALQSYLLVPDTELAEAIRQRLNAAREETGRLAGTAAVRQVDGADEYIERVGGKIQTLQREIDRVLALRIDPDRLFVAMPILHGRMLPAQQRFNTAATLALREAIDSADLPGQNDIYRHFAEARYLHAQMIGAFRLWIANRAGVFGDPEAAMRAQAANLALYREGIARELAALESPGLRRHLGLQQEESLRAMHAAQKTWLAAHDEAARIYASEHWRNDSHAMQTTIMPLLNDIWSALRELQEMADDQAVQDQMTLSEAARGLSRQIWWLTLIGLIAIAFGYLLFEVWVRRPIADVAAALRTEASGGRSRALAASHAIEMGDLVAAFALMRDQVHSRQKRLVDILDNAAEGIVTFDESGVIEGVNRAAETLFGSVESDLKGKDIATLFVLDRHERRREYLRHFIRSEINRLIGHEGELTGRHRDGTTFPAAVKVSRLWLDGRQLYTALVADISERKALVERLRYTAEHDGLTGLYNRSYVQEELERLVERVRRGNTSPCALLYLDLDNFKYVNDTLGHGAGDQLLIEVAGVLHRRARKSDLIARLGGDEFVVLLYSVTPALAIQVAESFRTCLADYTFSHEGERVDIGCSIGVAPIDADTASAADAFAAADLACHLAKRQGRNRAYLYQPQDAENVTAMSKDMGWSRRIKAAIASNRFVLAAQPIVETASGRINAYEVLIRMCDDDGGLIMPNGFLPAAERFGLMVEIDKWVARNAIETLAKLRLAQPQLRYSINLSASTLTDRRICDLIQERLAATGLAPDALTFEITETVAVTDLNVAIAFLGRLRELGCRTALDDFGSGMSSFAYLRDLPVDVIKIDGRFVRKLATNPVDQAIVRAMNDIAHALGKQTVAEFVENEETMTFLRECGIDFAQGYFLGRPEVTLPCHAIATHAGLPSACAAPAAQGARGNR